MKTDSYLSRDESPAGNRQRNGNVLPPPGATLNEVSRLVLSAVFSGLSFENILAANPGLTYHDIFRALGSLA